MRKITPHLWFDTEAKEAAEFYASVFSQAAEASGGGAPDSKVTGVMTLHDTPSGDADVVTFKLAGQPFMAISAGPLFKFNPSISFIVGCETKEEVDRFWEKLSDGGKALMPLDKYPFSERYGWIQDKYGISWQLILTKAEGDERPKIVPSLLFVKKKSGKAKEARDFYLSVFSSKGGSASGGKNSPSTSSGQAKEGAIAYFEEDTPFNQKKGDVMFSDFKLEDTWFAAMDGGDPHDFDFNEAISFIVYCDTQKEIDYYWEKLSAVPEADLPAPRPNTFYVYVIHCDDDSMYVGQAQDIRERWRKHEAGIAADHTRRHKPLGLIHYEEFKTREDAVKREQDLKTGFGRKWLKREWKAGRTRQAGQCGWLKDKYGVSWQIVPTAMNEMMGSGDTEKIARVTEAFLKMKKFDIAKLEEAAQ